MKKETLAARTKCVFSAVLMVMCASHLAGCESSLNKEGGIGLAGRHVTEQDAGTAAEESAAKSGSGAAPATDSFDPVTKPGNIAYKIGPLDVLEVSVFKVPELSKTVQVGGAGTINLPLTGEIPATGKTAQEIEHDLTARLGGKFLQNPQVTVYVKEYNSQRVTIEGAVKKPGVYPIRGKTSLLQFIAMAESVDRDSASGSVLVFRSTDGKRYAAKFDINDIRAGRAEDPAIEPGNVIIVDTSSSKLVFNGFTKMLPLTGAFIPFL
jgi:polysaccharide export outer membrane protein